MLSTVQEEPIEIDSIEEESSVSHDHSNGPTSLQIICDSANLGMYVYCMLSLHLRVQNDIQKSDTI